MHSTANDGQFFLRRGKLQRVLIQPKRSIDQRRAGLDLKIFC